MFDENNEEPDNNDYRNISLSSVRPTYHSIGQTGNNMKALSLSRAMMGCDFVVEDPSSIPPATARVLIETFMLSYMQLRFMLTTETVKFNKDNGTAFETPDFKYEIVVHANSADEKNKEGNYYAIEVGVIVAADPFLSTFEDGKYSKMLERCEDIFKGVEDFLNNEALPSASLRAESENFVFSDKKVNEEDTGKSED